MGEKMPIDDAVNGGNGTTKLVVHLPSATGLQAIKDAMWKITLRAMNGIDPERGRFDTISPGPTLVYSRIDGHYHVELQFPAKMGPLGVKNTSRFYDLLRGADGAYIPPVAEGNLEGLATIGRYKA